MSVINQQDVLDEVVILLRNSDVLTTTVRNVTRATETIVVSVINKIVIDKPNVKNIVNITLSGVVQKGYVVNYDDNNQTSIAITASIGTTYIVTYDYGPDKIFSGYPRGDLNIDSFPRIAVEYIDMVSDAGGFGNVNKNKHDITINVYAKNTDEIRTAIHNIRTVIISNQNSLQTLPLIKPVLIGPLAPAGEFAKFKDKIFKQNIDFSGLLQYEVNN